MHLSDPNLAPAFYLSSKVRSLQRMFSPKMPEKTLKEKKPIAPKVTLHLKKKSQAREEFDLVSRATRFEINWKQTRVVTSKYLGPLSPTALPSRHTADKKSGQQTKPKITPAVNMNSPLLHTKLKSLKKLETFKPRTQGDLLDTSIDKLKHFRDTSKNLKNNFKSSKELRPMKLKSTKRISSIQRLEDLSGVKDLRKSNQGSTKDLHLLSNSNSPTKIRRVKSQANANLFEKCFMKLALDNKDLEQEDETYFDTKREMDSIKQMSDSKRNTKIFFGTTPVVQSAKYIDESQKKRVEKLNQQYDANISNLKMIISDFYSRNRPTFCRADRKSLECSTDKKSKRSVGVSFEKIQSVSCYQ